MKKKPKTTIKSTIDAFVESLSPKERKQFDEEYKELLLSELRLAAMQRDDVAVRKLAKMVENLKRNQKMGGVG